MKKIFFATVAAALCSSSFADDNVLRVATDGAYPPFSEMNEKSEMVGFDIDIANALCKELGKKCEIKQIDWDGLIPSLNNRKIDAIIASMNATDDRRKIVAFTKPYYTNPGIFVRHKGSDVDFTPEGLQGKVVGVLQATVFDNYASKELEKQGVKIKRYNSQEDANLDAQSKRVDILFADKLVMKDGFLDRDNGKDFEQFGPEVNDPKYFGEGISIAVRKKDDALREALNNALDAIHKNGVYEQINNKYFDYDISGYKSQEHSDQ